MMTTQPSFRCVIPALLVLVSAQMQAQGTTRTLSKPEAEFAEPFTQVSAIRELRDGRVIVSDGRDKVVQLVDLKTGRASKIGREGSGPGEYGLPRNLVAMPGDTTFLFDPLNSRYLTILPDGKPGATFRLEDGAPPVTAAPTAGGRGGMQVMRGMTEPRGTDVRGYLYFEGPSVTFGPEGPVTADSAPVMRYDRKTYKYDTLTFVRLPKNNAEVRTSNSGGNRNVQVRMGGQVPFPARDIWTVLPNGTVAVARVADYHLDLIGANKQVVRGPAVPFTPVKVGEAEKALYRKEAASNRPMAIMRTIENGRTNTSAGPAPAPGEPDSWPTVKPPFTTSILAAPNGDVWVDRSRAAKDDIPRYDVFSSAGKLVGQVLLPRDTRVVALGNAGAVYTIRTDEDDLQYLQRFRR